MLKSINISLTTLCGANCIFCPSNRGKSIKEKIMPFKYLKKIVDEISSTDFKNTHNVNRLVIGENGDAFINKELILMLRYIRLKTPTIKIILCTNFQRLNQEKSKIIISEKLIDKIRCNIDGSNSKNYFNVKCLDLDNTRKNLLNFIKLRNEHNSKISIYISVLTLNYYIHTIKNNFNFYPIKLKNKDLIDIKDDFKSIKNQYKKILNKKLDKIYNTYAILSWAEREQINWEKINYNKYACPNLIRIEHEAFIAPDGTWYACCFDSDNQLCLGNIKDQSINDIYFGEKRAQLINLLKKRKFKEIGDPCTTVNCCQPIHKTKIISNFYRILFKNNFLVKILYYKYNHDK